MIKEKEIKEIVEINGLKGEGSKENPFIINSDILGLLIIIYLLSTNFF